MSMIQYKELLNSQLASLSIVNGQFIVVTDRGDIYFDFNNIRIPLGGSMIHISDTETTSDILAPIPNKIYFKSNPFALYMYVGPGDGYAAHWEKLTPTLDTMSDILITNKQIDDVLMWNGINWINKPSSSLSGLKTGTSSFVGAENEVTIAHGLSASPKSVTVNATANPQGTLGDVWVRWDATNIYIGNTGSYTGGLTWTAVI